MTKLQAIQLWHQITYEEVVAYSNDTGDITKTTPATALLRFLGVRCVIDYVYQKGWNQSSCKEVAKFLREFADALESEQ